jgi:hypothetical protein
VGKIVSGAHREPRSHSELGIQRSKTGRSIIPLEGRGFVSCFFSSFHTCVERSEETFICSWSINLSVVGSYVIISDVCGG